MGVLPQALPQALEIIFEVQRKRSNEKTNKKKKSIPTYKMCFLSCRKYITKKLTIDNILCWFQSSMIHLLLLLALMKITMKSNIRGSSSLSLFPFETLVSWGLMPIMKIEVLCYSGTVIGTGARMQV
jgi:hypothetical protein